MQQIPLTIKLPQQRRFDNFFCDDTGALAVDSLKRLVARRGAQVIGLQGSSGSGKSHLLEAVGHEAAAERCVYIPLTSCINWAPDAVLADLHLQPLVCVDDLQCLFSSPEWQQQFFHFYNRLIDGGGCLVFACQPQLASVSGILPDLLSRLKMALNFPLTPLMGESLEVAFLRRADDFGIQLSDDVLRYLLNHSDRNMGALMHWLSRLDRLSLAERRKPSVQLLKRLIEEQQ